MGMDLCARNALAQAMNIAPVITVFVRHTADCKGDESCKRCDCRKHLLWTHNRKQRPRAVGTRCWAEAERIKRGPEDQLTGRVSAPSRGQSLKRAIAAFKTDKQTRGNRGVLGKYTRELARFQAYCESAGVSTTSTIFRGVADVVMPLEIPWLQKTLALQRRMLVGGGSSNVGACRLAADQASYA
jgi:hypothetical protein